MKNIHVKYLSDKELIKDLYEISYRGEYSDYTKEAANRLKKYTEELERLRSNKAASDKG